jgi:hypothetical protein
MDYIRKRVKELIDQGLEVDQEIVQGASPPAWPVP